jgi:hypothetical protein
MVRRRSTVRFRNGAPGHRLDPVRIGPFWLECGSKVQQSPQGPSWSPSLRSASRVAEDTTSVYISIVMAILLCRRICMATCGWTSRAASSDPQDLRVAWTVIRRTRLADAPVEAAGEVARFDRRAEAGSEHQSGVGPAVAGLFPSGVLLLPAELEGGHAQVGEGEWGFRSLGLGGTAQELAAVRRPWPDLAARIRPGRQPD